MNVVCCLYTCLLCMCCMCISRPIELFALSQQCDAPVSDDALEPAESSHLAAWEGRRGLRR